jgi:hypothetical protein
MPLDNAGNTLTTARDLQLVNGNQVRSLSDRVDASDLTDYYRFRVQGRSSVGLKLNNSGGDANLELLNGNGDRLQDSLNSGNTSELINTALEAGTYYIRISSVNGAGSDYTLEVSQQSNQKADILWRNTVSGQDVVWQMDGTTIATGLSITPVPDLNWQMVASGDFNRDGQSDIVWRHSLSGQNVIWLMNGTTIDTGLSITPIPDLNWKITTAGDFNNDGQSDLVWRHSITGQNVIWLMDGTTIATGLSITPVADLNWQMITAGDFNNDGQSDLVWRHSITGQNVIWLMDGTTIASGLEITAVPDLNWKIVGSGDFDQDGQSDLVWRNAVSGQNVVWYMNCTTLRSGTELLSIPDLNWQIADVAKRYEPIAPIDLVGNTLTSAFNLGTLSGNSRFSEWIGGGDTSDHYKFTVINPSEINFKLSTPNALSNNALYDILDSAGNPILVQRSSLNPNLNALLSAGTYYIRINNSNQLTNYTLSIAATLQPLNTVTLIATDAIATERRTNEVQDPGRFTLSRSGNLTTALTVNYGIDGSATNGVDYSSLSGSVTFIAGQRSIVLPINILDDAIAEGSEKLTLTITSSETYLLGSSTRGTLTIADNDIASIVVTTPNNGEILRPGAAYNITWNDNISENVAIHLFKGNSFLRTLISSTESDGSYLWSLPTDIGYGIDYRIAVSTADARTYDFSNNYFSIKPDLKRYFFQYLFNPQNSALTDSYSGSVIAVSGKYSVTPQQSGGSYLISDLYNFTDRVTEMETDGRYVITTVSDYNDDLINDVGRVFVNQYVDRDQGSDQFFTPINFLVGQASGSNYLGSEIDYLDALRSPSGRFGQDYYEADPALPDPGNTIAIAEDQRSGIFNRNERVSSTDRDDFYRFSLDQSGIFTANLTALSGDADVRLIQDLNENGSIDPGEVLAWQWERGTINESIRRFLNAGTYFLQVMSYNNQTANYSISTDFQAAARDDRKFSIEVQFTTGSESFSSAMTTAVREAAMFWENVISYSGFNGSHQMTIQVGGSNQEWTAGRKVLASANPDNGSLDANGRWMPTSGIANINNNPMAIESLTSSIDSFRRVIIHEFGHVLGLGTLWARNGRSLTNNMTGTYNANTYAGLAYGELLSVFSPSAIPLTINQKDDTSNYSHWREEIFNTELMTHEAEFDGVMPLSQMTIASLRDIGWMVNYGAADRYSLPV